MNIIKKMSLGAFAVAVLFFIAMPAYAATNDYTHYWSFDEGAGRTVRDTGGENGTIVGSSTGLGWASGKVGNALGMDGLSGEAVVLPTNGFLTGSEGSLSVWIRIDDMNDRNVIFSGKSQSDNNVYGLLSVNYEGRIQFQFRTDASGNDRRAQASGVLNKNEWYNVVMTASTIGYKIYVNGEERAVAGDNIGRWFPDLTNQTFAYRIGASEANPLIGSWTGALDELRLYNRVLSQEEVSALFAEGNRGVPTIPGQTPPPSPAVPVTEVTITPPPSTVTPPVGSVSETPPASFTRNLALGARGTDVTSLQLLLIKWGMLAPGLSSGYFGQLTKDAVVKYQAANGLPATGFVGAMTRAKLGGGSAPAGTVAPTSTTSSTSGSATVDPKVAALLEMIAKLQAQLAGMKAAATPTPSSGY